MGVGPGNSISMRTNFPMRPQCGIYYYEIRVLKRGQDALIAVGFCRFNKLDKLPGKIIFVKSFFFATHIFKKHTQAVNNIHMVTMVKVVKYLNKDTPNHSALHLHPMISLAVD